MASSYHVTYIISLCHLLPPQAEGCTGHMYPVLVKPDPSVGGRRDAGTPLLPSEGIAVLTGTRVEALRQSVTCHFCPSLKGMSSVFFNKGENCIAAGRLFVENSIHDQFVQKVVSSRLESELEGQVAGEAVVPREEWLGSTHGVLPTCSEDPWGTLWSLQHKLT